MYTEFAYFMLVTALDLLPLFSIESLLYRSVALVLKFGGFHDKKYGIVDIVSIGDSLCTPLPDTLFF